MRVLVLCMALAGCGSVVVSTAAQLAGLSPLHADPADFEVGIDLPDGVDIVPDSARLLLTAEWALTGERIEEGFTLQRGGGDLPVWRVDPDDLDAMRALQSQIRAWEEQDADASSGSLGVTLTPCAIGDGPTFDSTVSVLIRIAQNGPLLPLVRDAPLRSFVDPDVIDTLEPCE